MKFFQQNLPKPRCGSAMSHRQPLQVGQESQLLQEEMIWLGVEEPHCFRSSLCFMVGTQTSLSRTWFNQSSIIHWEAMDMFHRGHSFHLMGLFCKCSLGVMSVLSLSTEALKNQLRAIWGESQLHQKKAFSSLTQCPNSARKHSALLASLCSENGCVTLM